MMYPLPLLLQRPPQYFPMWAQPYPWQPMGIAPQRRSEASIGSSGELVLDEWRISHIESWNGRNIQKALPELVIEWCLQKGIYLKAQHLAGKQNITAYFLSCHLRDSFDWILNEEIFSMINDKLGPLDIDLFATRFSTYLPRFVSWRPDPKAEVTDAFLQDWSAYKGYAHPPWCLISKVLFKTQAQGATLVIVVPLWQTQAWFPQLVDMLVESPTRSGNTRTISEL